MTSYKAKVQRKHVDFKNALQHNAGDADAALAIFSLRPSLRWMRHITVPRWEQSPVESWATQERYVVFATCLALRCISPRYNKIRQLEPQL